MEETGRHRDKRKHRRNREREESAPLEAPAPKAAKLRTAEPAPEVPRKKARPPADREHPDSGHRRRDENARRPRRIGSSDAIQLEPLRDSKFDSADAIEVEPLRRGKGKEREGNKDRERDKDTERDKDRAREKGGERPRALKAGSEEILFGKVALDCGYVEQKAIDKCVAIQKGLEEKCFLGELLMREDYLTRAEVNEIIEVQNKNLRKRYAWSGQPADNTLFGALVVAHGFATREQVNEVVRLQAEIERFDERLSLGELMVECAYLTETEVKQILALQKKREYRCYKCREVFTVGASEFGRKIRCPHCRKILVLPETPESLALKKIAPAARIEPIDEVESVEDIRAESRPTAQAVPEAETTPPVELEKAGGWYVSLRGKIFGPLKLEIIRKLVPSDVFHRHDLFWHESLEDWKLAGDISEIACLFPKPSPLPPGKPGRRPQAPVVLKDGDLSTILDRIESLFEKGAIAEKDYREIERILAGS
ncbi:MAG: DUF4339 domain-containing protein [Planctomycetes bacterium]|nr:DUF4339 domain-containing protein [Planctomycetota bacterium]